MVGLTRQFSVVGGEDTAILRIAFATDDGQNVNQHFGSSKSFVIYGVNLTASSLIGVAEFCPIDDEEVDDKLAAKLEFLDGCVAVYCRACGASAVRQLLDRHVQPLKVASDSLIADLIKAFQRELVEGPSSWLAKAIMHQQGVDIYSFEQGQL